MLDMYGNGFYLNGKVAHIVKPFRYFLGVITTFLALSLTATKLSADNETLTIVKQRHYCNFILLERYTVKCLTGN